MAKNPKADKAMQNLSDALDRDDLDDATKHMRDAVREDPRLMTDFVGHLKNR